MSELGDLYRDWRKEKQEKRTINYQKSEALLIKNKIEYKKLSASHFRVKEYDYWPSTGLFIHIKTKKRGRGIFNLLTLIKE